MPTFREAVVPIVMITIASAIVMLLLAPLDATAWAEGFRGGASAENTEAFDGGFSIIMIIGPLIKITIIMGVPALITLGVRRLIGRARPN